MDFERIAIVGATGPTGRELAAQLVERGHRAVEKGTEAFPKAEPGVFPSVSEIPPSPFIAPFYTLGPRKISSAMDHAVQLLAWCEGISLIGHVYEDERLIKRQTQMIKRWIDEVQ